MAILQAPAPRRKQLAPIAGIAKGIMHTFKPAETSAEQPFKHVMLCTPLNLKHPAWQPNIFLCNHMVSDMAYSAWPPAIEPLFLPQQTLFQALNLRALARPHQGGALSTVLASKWQYNYGGCTQPQAAKVSCLGCICWCEAGLQLMSRTC